MNKADIKKVVLAYSGGLDTSIIIPWLKENCNNCEVIAVSADVGQGTDDVAVGHRIALGEIAGGGGKLAVRSARLAYDDGSILRIRCFDPHGILQLFLIDPHKSTLAFPGPGALCPVPATLGLSTEDG